MPNSFKINKKEACPTDIDISLSGLQEMVDGYIEAAFTVPSPDGGSRYVTGYVNEEGAINDMDICLVVNNRALFGPCIITGLDYASGDSHALSETEIAWLGKSCTELGVSVSPDGDVSKIFNLKLA